MQTSRKILPNNIERCQLIEDKAILLSMNK